MRVVRVLLAAVVVIAAGAVVAGVGQGAPPPTPALSAKAEAAQAARVRDGSHGVQVGRRLFVSEGCSSCHTIASAKADGKLGPRLDVVLKGAPRSIIKEFIVNPKIASLPGYDNNLMRRDYASRLTPGEIRALTSYIHAAVG